MADRLSRRTLLIKTGTVGMLLGFRSQESGFRLQHTEGEKIAVLRGAQPILEYRYAKRHPKTYVHPFFAPDGTSLTENRPEDHIHLQGVMLAWSDVNGFDFWGEVNPLPHGQIVHEKFEHLEEGESALLTSVNHWIAEERVLMVERRAIRVPAQPARTTWMEWESELRPVREPVRLSASGHVYNGLGARFVPGMTGGSVLNSNGTTTIEKANGEPANWCTYFGPRGPGAAIFDHPDNPRHPTPFFVMNRPYGYLSAAPTFRVPITLEPGGSLLLRFAVAGYLGTPDAGVLDEMYRKWTMSS